MKASVTQEFEYGCGIACYAFALDMTYLEAVAALGTVQATSRRFWVKDLVAALNKSGKRYTSSYVKPGINPLDYPDGTIVLIRRSPDYPVGHYLIRYKQYWMDPWINLPANQDIQQASSGYRRHLPGEPMYVIQPS